MNGCEGCFTSPRGQQEAFETIKAKAKTYALEQKKAVAIYREGYEFRYCDAELAITERYNIAEVVSGYN